MLLLERERFPRFHIGESLLPESNRLLRELGVAERICDAGFVVKRGASFWSEDGERESYIDFSLSREVREPRTYQVPRDRFDQILLDNARDAGAEVREGCRAERFELENGRIWVEHTDESGAMSRTGARVLIDASGQRGLVARALGLRRKDPQLRSVAVHSQFEGVEQLDGERAGDIRIVSLSDLSWVWLIPLSPGVTSVGVVVPREHVARREALVGDLLEGTLAGVPSVARLFEGSKRIAPVHREADFSYAPTHYAGDRWLLAGDAGSFLDPVFSTGVLLALESGCDAGRAALRGLERNELSAAAFRDFDSAQKARYRFFRRMVAAFYDPAFRDVMFRPSNRAGILGAMVSTLAGNSRPGWMTRCRINLLFWIVALHRRLGFSERIHSTPAIGDVVS